MDNNSHIQTLLSEQYGINSSDIKPIQYGNAECWKILSASGDVFFKKVRPETISSEERFNEVIKVQNLFAENNIPVVKPILTKEGNAYFKDGDSIYILYPFVEGVARKRNELTDTHIKSLAKTLAAMHLVGRGPAFELSYQFKGWKSRESFNAGAKELLDFINNKSEKTELDEISIRFLNAKSRIVNSLELTYDELGLKNDHIVHGDYQENNVFFDENGEVKWVIDFDTTQQAPRSREVARALDFLCIDRSDLSETGLRKAKLFFDTYNEIYPLSGNELKLGFLAQFMKTSYSIFQFTEHYFNNGRNGEEFIRNEDAENLETYFQKLDDVVKFLTT